MTAHEIAVVEFVAPRVVGLVLLIVLKLIATAVIGALWVIEIGCTSC